MRNSKKLIAVIMTVALLASMMVPALAASYQTEATALTNAGLMNGTPGTGLDTLLTRAQGVTFTVRALGAEKAAIAMTAGAIALQMAKVVDYAAVPGWATNYVAYAIQEKITNGNRLNADGRITFSAADPLSGRQFITMMLRALGYTGVTLDNCLDKAVASGMLTASKAILFGMKAQLTRDDAAYIIYSTVNMGNVAIGGITVGAVKLVNYLVAIGSLTTTAAMNFSNYVAPTPVAPALLTVTSVTATNLKEIVVKFSAAPDKTTAETAGNYVLSTGTVSKAVLVGDTVTLTIATNAAQQAALDVTVKNVKSTAGVAIVEVTKTVTMFDVTLPMFVSYVFTGPQTIELTYSEPIMAAGTATIDNGIYGAATAVSATKNNVIVVSLGTSIPVGVHTLKMVGVKDYAYTAIDATMSITYVANTTPPTVVLSKATQTSVTLTFSKDVTGLAKENFYHTYTSYGPKTVKDTAGNEILVGNYYNEVVLDFSEKPLPAGLSTVVVLKAVGDVKVTDRWGNVMAADAMLSASTTADLIAPTVILVDATAETTVVVSFSEDVTSATATAKANYVFKKTSDGTVVTPAAAAITYNATDFKATITFAPMAGGSYTVAVSGIKDASLNGNTIATVTVPFVVSDKTPPTIPLTAEFVDGTTETVYITFNEAVATTGVNSAIDVNNYRSSLGKVPTAAVLFGSNGKKVKLTFANGEITAIAGGLIVGQIADLAGNKVVALSTPVETIAIANLVVGNITTITTKSLNTVEVVINKVIPTLAADAFLVTNNAVTIAPAMISYSNDGTKTTVILTLTASTALTNANSKPTQISIVATKLVSDIGATNPAVIDVLAAAMIDGISPTITAIAQTSPTVITVTYDEAVGFAVAGSATYIAQDFIVTMNDISADTTTTLVPGVDYTTAVVGGNVTITPVPAMVNGDKYTISTKATIVYTLDADSLTIKANAKTAVTEIVADVAAPTVVTQLPVAATILGTAADGTHTLIFSEVLNVASKAAVKAAVDAKYVGAGTSVVTSAWSGATLTVTYVPGTATPADDIAVSAIANIAVTDIIGNTSAALDVQLP